MVNVHDHAHSLARALRESSEHRAYQAAKERLKGNQNARQMIDDFHKKQIELQSLVMQGKEPSQEQKDSLQRLYAIVQSHTEAREYLAAEQRLAVLVGDIYKIIGEAVDLEGLPGL